MMLGALAASPSAVADTLRCDGRLVGTGADAAEVLAVCGTPAWRDPWRYPGARGAGYAADDEEWYYDFGPTRLLRILRFRHGRLVAIESDGYGAPPERDCGPSSIVTGLSKYRLLRRCGEPFTRESYGVLRPLARGAGSAPPEMLEAVFRERWVYNFGPRYFLQRVTIENGRVTDVDSGDRGFDTH
jgi:hypothetical protein